MVQVQPHRSAPTSYSGIAAQQMELFASEATATPVRDITSTFADNLSLPIHRWFRYSAGFSALWVRDVIQGQARGNQLHVLDPFAGSGTVPLEGEYCDIEALGLEAHPFIARVARAKLHWRENPTAFARYALAVLAKAKQDGGETSNYPPLIEKCFPPEVLRPLDALRRAYATTADGSPYAELTWLALASILRDCSPVGTAQWQYVLPKKSKARSVDPFDAFALKVGRLASDMTIWQARGHEAHAALYHSDARTCAPAPDHWADLVLSSPPYANNYDYADATRLEMSFFGEITGWGDLQATVRERLVPSCTQQVSQQVRHTPALIMDPLLAPIRDDLSEVCHRLEAERSLHNGKKAYHTMIAAYFQSMAQVWVALRRVTKPGGTVCFVIGDSAPYGVYVPVDEWLGRLALAVGFEAFEFMQTRERNIKWKNRKHRVPLHEGQLWVRG